MKKLLLLFFVLGYFTLNVQANDALVAACKAGNLAEVKSLVEKGADVNYGVGAPISAAVFYADVLKYLIEKGAKVNVSPSYPPLVQACLYGSPEAVKALLDGGADPNIPAVTDLAANTQKLIDAEKAKGKDANKGSIKMWESSVKFLKASPPITTYAMTNLVTGTNCLDCMKMMVEKGAKTDVINPISGSNLLGDFATSGRSRKARAASNKVNADALEKYGMPMPDWYKNPDESKMAAPDEIIKFLVITGVDINMKNKLSNAPLMEALVVPSAFVQPEVIIAFINNGADIKIESILYGKPMLIAAGNGQVDVMEALLAKGANINDDFYLEDNTTGQSLKGITLLMWAASRDHLNAVKFLIEKGVNLNGEAHGRSMNHKTMCVTKVTGKNAMYFAIESGNIEIVQALLDSKKLGWGGAFVILQMKNEQNIGALTFTTCFAGGGYIPSSYAKELGFPEIQKLLKSKMI